MTEEEIARFERVLREADRIRQEIALEEAFYAECDVSPKGMICDLEHSPEEALLLVA